MYVHKRHIDQSLLAQEIFLREREHHLTGKKAPPRKGVQQSVQIIVLSGY